MLWRNSLTEDNLISRTVALLACLLVVPVALARSGATVEDLIASGRAYLTDNCHLAQVAFQAALRDDPGNLEAKLGKGEALVCQGQFELGIDQYRRVLDGDPNHVRAHVQLALAFSEQYGRDSTRHADRLDEALDILEAAQRLDANSAQVHNAMGIIQYQSESFESAQTSFERAISLAQAADFSNSALSTMNVNLGNSLRELGDLERARTAFRRAIALNPANASAHNNLGQVYYALGDCKNAVYELTQAVNLNPGSTDAAANLAISTFECEDPAASIPLLKQAIDGGGGLLFPPLYTYLARAYLEQGRVAEAVQEAQKGALLPPATPEGYYYLGQAYQARAQGSDQDSARDAFERCLEVDPDFSACREALDAGR